MVWNSDPLFSHVGQPACTVAYLIFPFYFHFWQKRNLFPSDLEFWPSVLHLHTWPRYSQCEPSCQTSTLEVTISHTHAHTHTQPVGHEVVGNWRITNTGFINQKTDTVVLEEVLACPSFHQCCTVVHLTAAPATQVCGHHKTNLQIQNIHQLKWHFKFSFIQCLE